MTSNWLLINRFNLFRICLTIFDLLILLIPRIFLWNLKFLFKVKLLLISQDLLDINRRANNRLDTSSFNTDRILEHDNRAIIDIHSLESLNSDNIKLVNFTCLKVIVNPTYQFVEGLLCDHSHNLGDTVGNYKLLLDNQLLALLFIRIRFYVLGLDNLENKVLFLVDDLSLKITHLDDSIRGQTQWLLATARHGGPDLAVAQILRNKC